MMPRNVKGKMSKRLVMFSVVMCAGLFARGAGLNVVPNAGFEELDATGNPSGWAVPAAGYCYEDGAGLDGSRALVIERTDAEPYCVVARMVPFKPGRWYRVGGSVKLTGLRQVFDTRISGNVSGARVAMAFYDADGTWKTERASTSAKGDTPDWCEVETVFRAPTNVASAKLYAFLDRGLAGRAVFDDLFVTEIVRRPIVSLVSDAYRDCAANGRVTFFAAVDAEEAHGAARGEFLLPYAGGWMRRTVSCTLTNGTASVSVDVASIPVGTGVVQFRLLDDAGRTVDSRTLSFERVRRLPARTVSVDRLRRLVVNGKPFFPLGMYTGKLKDDSLARYAAGPFNCLQTYGELSRADMDRFHAAGLRVICSVKDAFVGTQWKASNGVRTREDELSWVTYYLRELKDHPALLAWYVMDEGHLSLIPRLEERYRLLKALDPEHPTWGVMCNMKLAPCYGNCFDITGADPYPIMRNPPKNEPPRTIDRVASWARVCDAGAFGTKAVWMVPQAFDWGWCDGRRGSRVPTRAEMSNMAWQSIAAGANGVIWYSYDTHVRSLEGAAREAFWEDVKAASAEIRDRIPTMLSGEPSPAVLTAPTGVVARTWRREGCVWVLAVNAAYEPTRGEIALIGGGRVPVELPALGVRWIAMK